MELVSDNIPFFLTRDWKYPKLPNAYMELLPARSAATIRAYGFCLLQWFQFCEDNGIDWDNPGQRAVLAYSKSLNCTNSSHNYYIARISEYYQFAKHYGVPNPFERLIGARNLITRRVVRSSVRLPSLEQVKCVFEHLPEAYRLMGQLMLYCGLRRAEVTSLEVSNLAGFEVNGEVRIVVNAKGGGQRVVALPKALCEKLKLRAGEKYVFSHDGKMYSNGTVSHAFAAASQKTGIRIYPHMLRHLYASYRFADLARSAGGRPQEAALLVLSTELGHKSLKTTLHYIGRINANTVEATACQFVDSLVRKGAPA